MKFQYPVYMLCVECKKIYKLNFGTKYFLGIFLVSISFGTFIQTLYNNNYGLITKLIVSAIATIIFILGLVILSDIYKKERNCTVCNGKKTLIKLDTPKAIEIIKQNNLSLPTESPEEDKFPWETKS